MYVYDGQGAAVSPIEYIVYACIHSTCCINGAWSPTVRCLSGKLWYLQQIYVGNTIVYHQESELFLGLLSTAMQLTHWVRVTHICVSKPTTIGSDNGLSPGRRQAIIWTNAGILLIGPLGTNFIEISIGIQTFPFKKMHLKMSSAKWRPFCLGLNVLSKIAPRRNLL